MQHRRTQLWLAIQTDIFTEWFHNFVHFIKPSADDPVLLIVDGHY
jgi:hypothetical protein